MNTTMLLLLHLPQKCIFPDMNHLAKNPSLIKSMLKKSLNLHPKLSLSPQLRATRFLGVSHDANCCAQQDFLGRHTMQIVARNKIFWGVTRCKLLRATSQN